MDHKKTMPYFLASLRNVFSFFFFLGRKTKRTKIFYLISFLPVVMAFIIKFSQIFSDSRGFTGIYIFSNMIIVFYLQFLILILALFFWDFGVFG